MTYASVSTMRPLATPSVSVRTTILPMRNRANWAVSTGSSARSSTRGHATVAPISPAPLDPVRPRRSGPERVGKALGLAGHLAIRELHDAHRTGRPAVSLERVRLADWSESVNHALKQRLLSAGLPRLEATRSKRRRPSADWLPRTGAVRPPGRTDVCAMSLLPTARAVGSRSRRRRCESHWSVYATDWSRNG
jgi:hypothetical protein